MRQKVHTFAAQKYTTPMELRHLHSFVAVAETKSMSVAATRCNTNQSSVSRHIKAIESELRVTLFDRKSKEVKLTEEGEQFLAHARIMIKDEAEMCDAIASMSGELCGELRIGVGSFIEPYIRRAAVAFMRKYPKVLLRVNFDSAAVLNKMLRHEDIDLAFTMNVPYHYEGITYKPCIPFHLSCIMPKTNPLAQKESVTFDDLMGCRIIMPDVGERVFQTFQRYTPFDLSKLPVVAIVGNPSAVLMVLDELDAITFLPSDYTITSQRLVAKPIETLDMELMSNAHWLSSTPIKASAKAFLEEIEKVANSK